MWDCPLQAGRTDTTECSHDIDQGVSCIEGKASRYSVHIFLNIYRVFDNDLDKVFA